ncbi:hypothetical protein P152DRAFT_493555 [Eremomyces bilateralis CBS 781.70]|uniref:Uncharacterized protein n=1 Tax=Eremomyces bilateralis CBS 781.70 TaxID=1392243 RepID=A0A6G1FVQ1_9PEZI|nr:uncharacterized protein P152DRAFT_493555 [Eremomyces bilateralis CBS 781.70]KAF1809864.1 hypothetical protein P152DRAFT_493555 [Eremomyces bilateralis CBS 781.70]
MMPWRPGPCGLRSASHPAWVCQPVSASVLRRQGDKGQMRIKPLFCTNLVTSVWRRKDESSSPDVDLHWMLLFIGLLGGYITSRVRYGQLLIHRSPDLPTCGVVWPLFPALWITSQGNPSLPDLIDEYQSIRRDDGLPDMLSICPGSMNLCSAFLPQMQRFHFSSGGLTAAWIRSRTLNISPKFDGAVLKIDGTENGNISSAAVCMYKLTRDVSLQRSG